MPMPVEIIGLNRPEMTIVWEDGHRSIYAARELRLRCRCALCIEEMTGAKLLDPEALRADVRVTGIELVGQYALALRFSDSHSTGIYRLRDLRDDCPCEGCVAERAKRQ